MCNLIVLNPNENALWISLAEAQIRSDKNKEAIRTLMNIYGTLGDTDGFKSMKALLEE